MKLEWKLFLISVVVTTMTEAAQPKPVTMPAMPPSQAVKSLSPEQQQKLQAIKGSPEFAKLKADLQATKKMFAEGAKIPQSQKDLLKGDVQQLKLIIPKPVK